MLAEGGACKARPCSSRQAEAEKATDVVPAGERGARLGEWEEDEFAAIQRPALRDNGWPDWMEYEGVGCGFWGRFGDNLNQKKSGLANAQRCAAGVSKLWNAKLLRSSPTLSAPAHVPKSDCARASPDRGAVMTI